MSVILKTSPFLRDLAERALWYDENAGHETAERFVNAVEEAVQLVGQRPRSGRILYPRHPRLHNERRILLPSPFQNHLLFYRITESGVTIDRLIHGARDLPRRLLATSLNTP